MKVKEQKLTSAEPVLLADIIELGGGSNPRYHPNLDAQNVPEVDIVCDLRDGIPLDDESVEEIFSQDFFEHFTFWEGLSLLKECKRVLKPEGIIRFIIPDIAEGIKVNDKWNHHISNILYGTRWHDYDVHKMWYTPDLAYYIFYHEGWVYISFTVMPSEEPKFVIEARKPRRGN